MRRALACLAVVALLPVSSFLDAAPARATQAPVAFTSAALPTWQVGGDTAGTGIAWAVAQAGGLVFVGGSFSTIRPPGAPTGTSTMARADLAVFDAATGNPTSCAPAVTLPADPTSATVRALDVSPDGRTLYIGGYFSTVGGVPVQHLAALDIATCTVITSFKPLPNGLVRAVDATADAVYYGGGFTTAGGQARTRAAAAAAVGTATPGGLLPWAPTFDNDVNAVAVKPDGSQVVVGGNFNLANGQDSRALAVTDTSGALAMAYPLGFIGSNSAVRVITVDSTGFYTGNEGTGGGVFDGRLAVNWADLGQRWRDTCLGATQALALYQGVLYSGSHAHDCSSMGWFPDGPRNHFLAETVDGDQIQPWYPNTDDGLGESIGPRGMVVASSTSGDVLWAVGEFTQVNGVAQQGLTRFGTGPDTAAPSVPLLSVSSPRAGQARIAWRTSLDTDDATITYRVLRDSSTTPVLTTTADSRPWNRPQLTFTDTGLPQGSTHTYRVSASDGTTTITSAARTVVVGTGVSAYAERVMADGASSLWRYDDPADVLISDTTGAGDNATMRGSATFGVTPAAVTNDPSKAITLPGTGYAYAERAQVAPTTFSVETFFKTTTTTGGKLIGFGNKQLLSSTSYDRHVYMANDGTLVLGVAASNGLSTVRSTRAYNDGLWHQVVGTQDDSGISLYVDGVRVGHSPGVGTTYTGYWRLGGDNLNGWPLQPTATSFAGSLDETAVYPTALSASTVADHYVLAGGTLPAGARGPSDYVGQVTNALDPSVYWRLDESGGSSAADASGNGQAGTLGQGAGFGARGVLGGGATFSGGTSGTLSTTTQLPAPDRMTELVWFQTRTNRGGKIIGFGDRSSGSSGSYDRHVWMRDDGRLSFGVYTPSGTQVLTSASSYNDGAYHQLAATRSDTGMALYVDGGLVASNTVTDPAQVYRGYVRVGGDSLGYWNSGASSDYFSGNLDEIAVFSKALTAAQVASTYNAVLSSGPDLAAPTAATGLTATTSGGAVQLGWAAASDNVAVTGYAVHRSATRGFVPGPSSLITTVTGSGALDTPPPGLWYYAVVALDAAGNAGPASNPATAYVLDTTAPTAPADASVTTTLTTASLTWSASTDDVGVALYTVHRATAAGFTPTAANQVGSTTGTSLVDTPATTGRYYYRVIARDASGNASAPTPELSAFVGDTTAPSTPGDPTTAVSGTTVTVTWPASTDDLAVTAYDVYRSASPGATPVPAGRVGTTAGTTLADTGVPEGTWYYRVVARDAAGNQSVPSNDATAVLAAQTQTLTVSPSADSYANAGAPSTSYGTSSTLTSRGSPGSTAYLRFAFPATPAGKALVGASLRYRTTTDPTSGSSVAHRIAPAGDTWTETTLTWNNRPAVSAVTAGTIPAGTLASTTGTVTLDPAALQGMLGAPGTLSVTSTGTDALSFWSREQSTSANRPMLSLVFAPVGETSPPSTPGNLSGSSSGSAVSLSWSPSSDNVGVAGYDVYRSATPGFTPDASSKLGTVTGTGFADVRPSGTWYYAVDAFDAAGNTSAPSAPVAVTVVDTQAPTAPTDATATTSGSTITIAWTGSTDDVAVGGYEVYRSPTAGSPPGPSTLVATVPAGTGTTYADSGRPTGTWYYVVLARDTSGNASAPSAEVSGTIVGGPPVTVSVTAVADSYGNAGAPSSSFGTSLTLTSRGTTGSAAFLRFVLPAAPPGKSLVDATLRIRTTTEATAGSLDAHTIGVAADSWVETTLTWNNRPALTGPALGALTGATAVNTPYTAALSVSALGALLGTQQTLSVTSTGTDSLSFFSHEHATAGNRPQLLLTFS